MTRRKLTAEEIDLWHRAVQKTERLNNDAAVPRPLPKPKPIRHSATKPPEQPGRPAAAKPKPAAHPHAATALKMDRKAFGRMKRGKLVPEARIDLHGMTLDRAHPALTRFILSSQASGRRLVLVITGKGKPADQTGSIPVPHGILRRNVPMWLNMPPLAQAVLQVERAHISHGGEGALYVYLRRAR